MIGPQQKKSTAGVNGPRAKNTVKKGEGRRVVVILYLEVSTVIIILQSLILSPGDIVRVTMS